MFITRPSTGVIPDVSAKRKNIRVVIADDHPIVRDALKMLLAREEDIEVVGEAGDGREALDRVQELDPDVLLLDLRMPNLDGFSVLKALQPSSGGMKVIVMTASEDKKEFVQAMKLGSSGLVLKQTSLGLDRQEYEEGERRRDLAGFTYNDCGDGPVLVAGYSLSGTEQGP
jgi:CheY-like chemotaxis protein